MAGDDERPLQSLWFKHGSNEGKVFEDEAHGDKLYLGYLPLVPKSIMLNRVAGLVNDQGWTMYDKKGLQKRVGNPNGNTCETAIVVTGTPDPGYPGGAGAGGGTAATGGVGAGAGTTAVPQVPSQRQKFVELLKEARISRPLPEVISTVIKHYGRRLEQIETPNEAYELYKDAKNLPGSSTKRHLLTQQGLYVNGPLFPEAAKSNLVTAVDCQSGRPCVIKFLGQDAAAASGEAQATRIICSDMPAEVPLVRGWLVDLTLSEGHMELHHLPGTHPVLVMPRYLETLESTLYVSNEVLAREMQRMVQALEWIHGKGYVHMDVKNANIFINHEGLYFLGDLGSAVKQNSPIVSTTLVFVPFNHLLGTPARYEYDWYMLLAALVCKAQPKRREELRDSKALYLEATKLMAWAEQLASDAPVLRDLVSDLVKRAGDLFHA